MDTEENKEKSRNSIKDKLKIVNSRLSAESLEDMKKGWTKNGIIIGLLGANIFLLILVFAMALRPKKEIGFVVEVNSLTGEQRTVRNAVKEMEKYTAPEYLMINTVKSYITNLRSVSTDNGVNRENIKKVFAFTTGKASGVIRSYFNANPPLDRSRKERVEVVIYNATPINTARNLKFQVDWNETVRSITTGEIITEKNYRADIDANSCDAVRTEAPVSLW